MSMGLSLLQSVQDEADHSEKVSRLKGELRDAQDEIELKKTLLRKSKENASLLEGQLASLRAEMENKERVLAERDELLRAEKSKADFNAAQLKESAGEVVHHKA
jgi:chromosome segregation ATPase